MAPLHIATQEGHVRVVRALLAAPNVDVNIELGDEVEDGRSATPLYLAAQEALMEIVKLFVADGRAFPKRSNLSTREEFLETLQLYAEEAENEGNKELSEDYKAVLEIFDSYQPSGKEVRGAAAVGLGASSCGRSLH